MAKKRLSSVLSPSRVEDHEDFVRHLVKKEFVELNDESSPTKSKINLQSSKQKRARRESYVNPRGGIVKSSIIVQAEHLQSSLGTESHSVIKSVAKSHTTGSYSVCLPVAFGRLYLPEECSMVTILDENDVPFEVKYTPKWACLSSGWKQFSVSHNLQKGEMLVFHVIEPKLIKVYIIRGDDNANIELGLSDSPAQSEHNAQGDSIPSDDLTDQSNHLGTFEEFQTKTHSLCLISDIDEKTLKKYYELCQSKNNILHDKVPSGLDSKLVTGIITETVKIVDAVKACDHSTPTEKLEQWEKLLKSFKLLGMKVEFLVDRVSQLLKLRAVEVTQFDEIKNLEGKQSELKDLYEKVGVIIQRLKSKAEMHRVKIQQLISSPW